MQIAPAHIQEVVILVLRDRRADPLEAGIRAQAEETQEQPALEGPVIETQPGPGLPEVPHKAHAQLRLLQDIREARHRPTARDLGFEAGQVRRVGLSLQGGGPNPPLEPLQNLHPCILGHAQIERRKPGERPRPPSSMWLVNRLRR
jgi:hypothetical protein